MLFRRRPQARLLRMAPKHLMDQAGPDRIALLNGDIPVFVPLQTRLLGQRFNLQGVYKLPNGRVIAMGSTHKGAKRPSLDFYDIEVMGDETELQCPSCSYVAMGPDLAHVNIEPHELRGQGLGTYAASKAERHVRSLQGGRHEFRSNMLFAPIFRKAGYRTKKKWGIFFNPFNPLMYKEGPHVETDNLERYHNISVLDENGRPSTIIQRIKD